MLANSLAGARSFTARSRANPGPEKAQQIGLELGSARPGLEGEPVMSEALSKLEEFLITSATQLYDKQTVMLRLSRIKMPADSNSETAAPSLRVGRVAAPLREQAVAVLREAILDFRLKPGQRLIERELVEQTGVSRTTIREVLRQLTAEGLVTTIPQRGAIVVRLSTKEVSDLYELRATLEQMTARLFVERASDKDVKQLRRALERMRKIVDDSDPDKPPIQALLDAKDRYYEVYIDGADNGEVRSVLAGLQARIRLMRATSMSSPGRLTQMIEELERVIRAVEARDAQAAGEAAYEHVMRAMRVGAHHLSDVEDETASAIEAEPVGRPG